MNVVKANPATAGSKDEKEAKMKMKSAEPTQVLFALLAAALAMTAQAVVFPGSGGDFGDDAAWGGTLPTGEPIVFDKGGTYWNSKEVSFNSITVTASDVIFDLAKYGKSVTLTNTGQSFRLYGSSLAVAISGGSVTNSGSFWVGGPRYSENNNNSVVVSNKCDLYIANQFSLGNCNGASFTITGAGTKGRANGGVYMSREGSSGDYFLSILDGATFHSVDQVFAGYAGGGKNKLTVSGSGSKFTQFGTKNFHVGFSVSGNTMEVSDGAEVSAGSFFLGSRNNDTSYSSNNKLFVSNATLTAGGAINFGRTGRGNYAYITNSTVSASGDFKVGVGVTSSNNVVVFSGSGTTLSYYKGGNDALTPYFGGGSYNEIILENGFSDTFASASKASSLSANAHDNTIRIRGGASLVMAAGNMYISTTNANSYANSVIAEDGGTFQFYNMRLCREDNRLVVSNGTIKSERNDPAGYSLHIGEVPEGSLATTTNNAIVVQGGSSLLTLPSSGVRMLNGSKLHFDIPASGEYTAVPIQAVNFLMDESCRLEAEFADCLASLGQTVRRITLAELHTVDSGGKQVGGVLTIPQSVLDAANEGLPEECKFYVDGRKLKLKLANPRGMVILVQ